MTRDLHPSDEWLLLRYRLQGDRGAREQLTARLLPLAEHVARSYRHPHHEPELRQAAALGLAKAIDRWDERRGTLRTYALPTMHGEVKRWLRDNAWPVHVPRRRREQAVAVMRSAEALTARTGTAPTVQEIGRELGLSDEEVLEASVVAGVFRPLSLDAPLTAAEDDACLGDVVGRIDVRLDRAEEMVQLGRMRGLLDDDERTALRLRFVDDLTQTQIAARMGCSQMQVSRMLRRALERLHGAAVGSLR